MVNFNIDLDKSDIPDGTKVTVTPKFVAKETNVPEDIDWSFYGNQKSFIAIKGDRSTYSNMLTVKVKPNKKYYYSNFSITSSVNTSGVSKEIGSNSEVLITLFGIMNQNSIGKLYFGNFDTQLNSYKFPMVYGTPIVRDDGKMIINKLLDLSSFGYQNLYEIMNSLYDGGHTEKWIGEPQFKLTCPIYGNNVIGTKVYAFANVADTQNKEIDWNSFSRVMLTRECKIGDNNTIDNIHIEDGEYKLFNPNITEFKIISRDARYLVYNNKTLYDIINNLSQDMVNPDKKAFVNKVDFGDFVNDVSDAGFVIAADMRKDSGASTPNRDWILYSPINNSSSILWHSEADISPKSAIISGNGQFIFALVTNKSGKKVFTAINRTSGQSKTDISISGIDLNVVNIAKMSVNNQGILQIQVEDNTAKPLVRTTKFYSFTTGKTISAEDLLNYLGLSNYLVAGKFHGFVGISPNGLAIGLYITDKTDDQFDSDHMNPTAIMNYKFGTDYIPEFASFADLIASIGS